MLRNTPLARQKRHGTRSMVTIVDARLQKAIEDAEQMLVVCAHAGAKVPNAIVRRAERLRVMLNRTPQGNDGVGRYRAWTQIPRYAAHR